MIVIEDSALMPLDETLMKNCPARIRRFPVTRRTDVGVTVSGLVDFQITAADGVGPRELVRSRLRRDGSRSLVRNGCRSFFFSFDSKRC